MKPNISPSAPLTRRTLLKHVAWGGMAIPSSLPMLARAASANGRLHLAAVGVAGKGWEDIHGTTGHGKKHDLVAICDVDHRTNATHPDNLVAAQKRRPIGIGAAAKTFPNATPFADYRRMFDKMHREIDGLTVSTPDHMHATVTLTAMALGKHVYCQKPLTHTVHEARVVAKMAAKQKVVTQMGNQAHSSIGYRTLVKLIQSGAIGAVREAHAWAAAPSWPQGKPQNQPGSTVPKGLQWDLWLGVVPQRPYVPNAYAPFNWRGWSDFGTGALGDMGCHILDPVAWSLALGAPKTIRSLGPGTDPSTYPRWTTVRYTFAATEYTHPDGVTVTWYDGGKLPKKPNDLPKSARLPRNGSLYVGDKGSCVIGHHPTAPRFFPEKRFRDFNHTTLKAVYKSFPRKDHYVEWTDACLGKTKTSSSFEQAGPLTETVLLGNVALRHPNEELAWDSKAFRFTNHAAATTRLRRPYEKGWRIDALSD